MIVAKHRVLILDMQPIDPPIGGGRLRLLGLYHNLGGNISAKYIGTYDWPGETFRDHYLSSTLREINIPLSNKHFAECQKWQELAGGKTVIDTTFHKLAHLSSEFVDYARNEVRNADIVILSHPWVYPLIRGEVDKSSQIVIYDSQNVEGYLRCTLLDDGAFGTDIVREVIRIEFELCNYADLILACSHEDKKLFNALYNLPFNKIKVVSNGVFAEKIKPVTSSKKALLKKQLGLGRNEVVLFLGSAYTPNIEAAEYIINSVAPRLPDILFVIAGSVGDQIDRNTLNSSNIIMTGYLADDEKTHYLGASDIAINPMLSGSGTNIKMFEFMAAGLPVISTQIGARGIANTACAGVVICDDANIHLKIKEVLSDSRRKKYLGEANRRSAEEEYSWEKISPQLGLLLNNLISKKNKPSLAASLISREDKMALMSTWDMRCGIAEYSRYLAKALEEHHVDIHIIANTRSDWQSARSLLDISRNINELWIYDHQQGQNSSVNIDEILRFLKKEKISKLNIQYHPGFFSGEILLDLAAKCIQADVHVSITFHNAKEPDHEILKELVNIGVNLIVHNYEEKLQLLDAGICAVHHITQGILEEDDEDVNSARLAMQISGRPVIGSFGFLRTHKGILELIEAVGILRVTYPDIFLLALNALYPSRDSEECFLKCKLKIQELGMEDNILLITDFIDVKQIMRYLHATDVIVLPYHSSTEGTSATAAVGLAARRPLIVSKSHIFDDIRDLCYRVDEIEPAVLAQNIKKLLANSALQKTMKKRILIHAERNSWKNVAKRYIEVFS